MLDIPQNIPILNLGSRCGFTEYIDFIRWEEVTSPIMTGYDVFGRKFVVIKFLIEDSGKPIMQTFFQRYSNDYKFWMGCGHATQNLLNTRGGMKPNQFKFINEIMTGKTIEITSDINSIFPNGLKVSLFNEKEWEAAKKIQNQWRLCRYNPKYKMCEKVQSKNMELILNT